MRVEGEMAGKYTAIRTDSMSSVEGAKGILISADETTGEVKWRGPNNTVLDKTLGPRSIKLIRRYPR